MSSRGHTLDDILLYQTRKILHVNKGFQPTTSLYKMTLERKQNVAIYLFFMSPLAVDRKIPMIQAHATALVSYLLIAFRLRLRHLHRQIHASRY